MDICQFFNIIRIILLCFIAIIIKIDLKFFKLLQEPNAEVAHKPQTTKQT